MTDPPFEAPRSKQDVVDLITTHRTILTTLLNDLSEEELVRLPGPQKNRSVKDLLAHLIWWEEYMMVRVLLVKSGVNSLPQQEPDLINESVYAMQRDLPLNVVREAFDLSMQRLLGFIQWLTWDEIEGGLMVAGQPVGFIIAGNTFGHYLEHVGALSRYVDAVKKSR